MALLSASVQIRVVAAIHLAIAYHLIFNPKLLDRQNTVVFLGQAMAIDRSVYFSASANRPISSILGLMFGLNAIGDIISAGHEGPPFYIYWGGQAPIRLAFFFGLAGFTYLYNPDPAVKATLTSTGLSSIKTNFVFTWAFMEVIAWFAVYSTIREERQNIFIQRERARALESE